MTTVSISFSLVYHLLYMPETTAEVWKPPVEGRQAVT
jgi:hypothetical protein